MTDGERLVALETKMETMQADVAEMKASLKHLENIAQQGGGALGVILKIGAVMGWAAGMLAGIYAMFHGH